MPKYRSRGDKTRLIALTGRAGVGKSFAAERFMEFGYKRLKFAGPLKDMLRSLGLSERHIEGDLKFEPCALLGGKTPRWAMQSLGTEWGRDLISPDLWVNAFKRNLAQLYPEHHSVVVDDLRFPNEAALIRELGGTIVRLYGRDAGLDQSHESEKHDLPCDVEIFNDFGEGFLKALDDLI